MRGLTCPESSDDEKLHAATGSGTARARGAGPAGELRVRGVHDAPLPSVEASGARSGAAAAVVAADAISVDVPGQSVGSSPELSLDASLPPHERPHHDYSLARLEVNLSYFLVLVITEFFVLGGWHLRL